MVTAKLCTGHGQNRASWFEPARATQKWMPSLQTPEGAVEGPVESDSRGVRLAAFQSDSESPSPVTRTRSPEPGDFRCLPGRRVFALCGGSADENDRARWLGHAAAWLNRNREVLGQHHAGQMQGLEERAARRIG